MEIAPKEMISCDFTQKAETPDFSYNFVSEIENDICYEELLIRALRNEKYSGENNECEKNYALSFLLFVGVLECNEDIFKILEELDIQMELKAILEIPQNSPEVEYLEISRISLQKRKQLISYSLEYSIQCIKPFCLKYIQDFLQTAALTPKINVDSIKIFLTKFNHSKFKETLKRFIEIECIIHPNKVENSPQVIDSLEENLQYLTREEFAEDIVKSRVNFK